MEQWATVILDGCQPIEVSSLGRIKTKRNKLSFGYADTLGYRQFGVRRISGGSTKKDKVCKVHRLVAMAFIPNPLNKPEVNHINGQKGNNCVENLEWCTHAENMAHCAKMGFMEPVKGDNAWTRRQPWRVLRGANAWATVNSHRMPRGENHSSAKLNENDVRQIRKLHKSGNYLIKQIAVKYGVSAPTIGQILARKAWAHVL